MRHAFLLCPIPASATNYRPSWDTTVRPISGHFPGKQTETSVGVIGGTGQAGTPERLVTERKLRELVDLEDEEQREAFAAMVGGVVELEKEMGRSAG
ncbi:MAG: hypothetical protein GY723_20590 [bacterium]|nr:hypothetical protein [bacterium]